MRLDKFLKITRIIKRRTIAAELCDKGNVSVNGVERKASYAIKEGDNIKVKYFSKEISLNIKKMPPEALKKDDILQYIEIL